MSTLPDKSSNGYIPSPLVDSLSEIVKNISKTYSPLVNAVSEWSDELRKTQLALSDSLNEIDFSYIKKIAELFSESLDGHFPKNWPENNISDAARLCMDGVPIVFVPREEIVRKIIKARDTTAIKKVIIANDKNIIDDCEKVISESEWLPKDMHDHINDAIRSYKAGMYRASQSTSAVAFDSLLNDVINIRKIRRDHSIPKQLSHAVVKNLTSQSRFQGDLMRLPLGGEPFYTLLMFPVIGSMLAPFIIGDKSSYTKELNRHESVHTVSSRQYKKSNALWSIMVITSICKITQLHGKNWMQVSAKAYGVDLS